MTKQELDFATGVQLAKWESESTGLKVVWSGVEGKFSSPLPFWFCSMKERQRLFEIGGDLTQQRASMKGMFANEAVSGS